LPPPRYRLVIYSRRSDRRARTVRAERRFGNRLDVQRQTARLRLSLRLPEGDRVARRRADIVIVLSSTTDFGT
jgi:hypothetical protein